MATTYNQATIQYNRSTRTYNGTEQAASDSIDARSQPTVTGTRSTSKVGNDND